MKTYHFTQTAHGTPAYGRRYVTWDQCKFDFLRGLDFTNQPSGRYFSIRDCAPGCVVQLRYGLKLQKTNTLTIPTAEESLLAGLQKIDNPSDALEWSKTIPRLIHAHFRPTRSNLIRWVDNNHISSIMADTILELRDK